MKTFLLKYDTGDYYTPDSFCVIRAEDAQKAQEIAKQTSKWFCGDDVVSCVELPENGFLFSADGLIYSKNTLEEQNNNEHQT